MGCDIHIWTEIQDVGTLYEGKEFKWWNPADGPTEATDSRRYHEIWEGRNYILFALLAGVRNEFDLKPIVEPRGLPADLSENVKKDIDPYDSDYHSHSYLTLAELEAFDWNQTFTRSGITSLHGYRAWKEQGMPNHWCGAVGGGNTRHVSLEAMEEISNDPDAFRKPTDNPDMSNIYTQVFWKQSYRDCCSNFLEQVLPELKKRVPDGDATRVRIVFCFDN